MLEFENPNPPMSQLVVTWLLMIPLFFFACRGILWFQASAGNGAAGSGFGSMTAAKGGGEVVILGSVFACVLAFVATRFYSILEMCWSNKLFTVLAFYALASCLWSQFPRQSLQFGIYIVLNLLFVFYLYSRFQPQAIMQLLSFTGWIVVVGSIVFAVALPRYGVDHRGDTAGSWQGLFVYKNTCAIMVTFLLAVTFYLPVRNVRDRVLRATYIVLTVFLVIMTRARTGWILLAVLLTYVAVMKFVNRFKSEDRRPLALLLCMASMFVAVVSYFLYEPVLLLLGKSTTLSGRTDIWKLVFAAAMKSPFLGYGYRAFWHGLQGESGFIVLMQRWTVPGSHNGLLETWLDLGLVGVGMVVMTMVIAVRNAAACLRNDLTPTIKLYVSILVMTIVANTVEMTLMFPNYLTWILYIFACVGLAREAKMIRSVPV